MNKNTKKQVLEIMDLVLDRTFLGKRSKGRERKVIAMLYGIHGSPKPVNEIAKALNLSKSRVSHISKDSIKLLSENRLRNIHMNARNRLEGKNIWTPFGNYFICRSVVDVLKENKHFYKSIGRSSIWINPSFRKCNRCSKVKTKKEFPLDKFFGMCKKCAYNSRYPAMKKYMKRYAAENPIQRRMRAAVSSVFQRNDLVKNKSTQTQLGCTFEEAEKHIESQFKEGMEWSNIHIDHILPVKLAETQEEAEYLNKLSNLQPLFVEDNIRKKDKILPEHEHLYNEFLIKFR